MINGIRKTAKTVTTIMNFCVNPTCLHATASKGCKCCSRGHGPKAQAKSKRK